MTEIKTRDLGYEYFSDNDEYDEEYTPNQGSFFKKVRPENWHMLHNAVSEYESNFKVVYRKLPRTVYVDDGHGSRAIQTILMKTAVKFFTTPVNSGSRIVNAVSGHKENAFTGKDDEYDFFKMSLSTGELGSSPGSNNIFFDSPSEYENLFHETLSPSIKEKWEERRKARLSDSALDNFKNESQSMFTLVK
jgi:hypothetical protein